MRWTTLLVFACFAISLVPAAVSHFLTPTDAQVVRSFEAYNGCVYVVKPGDNLFRIGLHYGVSYWYLASMNGIPNPNWIYAGMVIGVPCGGGYPSYPAYPPYPYYPPVKHPYFPGDCKPPATYTVKPGDNLFRIALNHGSTINWIRDANGLWGRVLRPNMVLKIPCPGSVQYRQVGTPTPTPIIVPPASPIFITATPPSQTNINIRNDRYRPAQLTVTQGTTVTWTNTEPEGGVSYTVTSGVNGEANGYFDSGIILPGGVYQFTFNDPGVYAYFSKTNPNMTGEITVQP